LGFTREDLYRQRHLCSIDTFFVTNTTLPRIFNSMCHTANNMTARTNIPPIGASDFATHTAADQHADAADETEEAVEEHHLETPELIRIGFVGLSIIAFWLLPWKSYQHSGVIGRPPIDWQAILSTSPSGVRH
jgi:hypothetical protein